tara:strand:+ start:228 stop:959 length:732 start_codon:yes stop_codon:yes gene_type:complete
MVTNKSYMDNKALLVKELDTLAINIDTAKTATITASEVCYRLINQGMTSTFFISCYNKSGYNLKTKNNDGSDIIIGVDTCSVEEEPFAKACAEKLFFNIQLKRDSGNAKKFLNAYNKAESALKEFLNDGMGHNQALAKAKATLSDKVKNIHYGQDKTTKEKIFYTERDIYGVARQQISSVMGTLRRFMASIETGMKNANEPKRVVPLKDKIDKKLTEIRKLISDADPKALQALPKSIKDIFDI